MWKNGQTIQLFIQRNRNKNLILYFNLVMSFMTSQKTILSSCVMMNGAKKKNNQFGKLITCFKCRFVIYICIYLTIFFLPFFFIAIGVVVAVAFVDHNLPSCVLILDGIFRCRHNLIHSNHLETYVSRGLSPKLSFIRTNTRIKKTNIESNKT